VKGLDVPALLDVTFIKIDKPSDIISAILPVIFNLAVAWWLLGSSLLIRRAYPESASIPNYSPSPKEKTAPESEPSKPPGMSAMEAAETKLAALVGKR